MIDPRVQRGFSLLETLVASVILSGTVVTVGALSTRALQGIARHQAYETAVDLADRQLHLIDYMGVDRFLEQGQTEGVFEEPAPGYHWSVEAESMDYGLLYRVTVTLTWAERGTPRSLSIDTRLNGQASVEPTGDANSNAGGRS
jgi:prepilin-type N-terminal cleavage/methylation domain-containing protein